MFGSVTSTAVSEDQKEDLKLKIKEKLKELGVDKQIHDLIAAKAGPIGAGKPAVSSEEAITQLKGRGVIDQLVKSLGPVATKLSAEPRGRNTVTVRLRSATGLQFYAKKPPEAYEQLVVCGELYGQRFRSMPVAAGASAQTEATLSVELPKSLQTADQLLTQRQPLHLVLMRTFPHHADSTAPAELERHNLESEVLGTAYYDWREAWCNPGQSLMLDVPVLVGGLRGADGGGAVVGTLHFECLAQTSQDPGSVGLRLPSEALKPRLAEESGAHADAVARFRSVVDAASSRLGSKPPCLIVASEDGKEYPVCAFVRPIHLGRCLASPQEACHFVSLIEPKLEWDQDVYSGAVGHFLASTHTIIAAGLANPDEKAVLLCSLLQGFGMDAYVTVGTHKSSPAERMWVVTFAASEATFWDPTTGHRSSPQSPKAGKPCSFTAIDHIFSHRRVYINLQKGTPLAESSFALEDAASWLEIAVPLTEVPSLPAQRLELQRPLLDTVAMEVKLEASIKQLLSAQRAQLTDGGSVTWDDGLGFLLMPTLASLERDATWGPGCWSGEDPLQSIKRAMPSGCTLLGVPHHSRCLVPSRIVRALLREPPAQDVLQTRSPDAAFALRVRVTAFPEHAYSCWVMLAVRTAEPIAALPTAITSQ